ncbi:hypothetical protein SKAU_G00282930 [Synaphobranchus kaupii]|uniref:Uncharacterized protein n=1 Tax=Synaphobranchus kaupii TaxID=118154 RepID=A0A9Q1EXF6_SYNKA|nr:hypothetical protein SKAU_G00282930 [Synaphobranchus kaupii]
MSNQRITSVPSNLCAAYRIWLIVDRWTSRIKAQNPTHFVPSKEPVLRTLEGRVTPVAARQLSPRFLPKSREVLLFQRSPGVVRDADCHCPPAPGSASITGRGQGSCSAAPLNLQGGAWGFDEGTGQVARGAGARSATVTRFLFHSTNQHRPPWAMSLDCPLIDGFFRGALPRPRLLSMEGDSSDPDAHAPPHSTVRRRGAACYILGAFTSLWWRKQR